MLYYFRVITLIIAILAYVVDSNGITLDIDNPSPEVIHTEITENNNIYRTFISKNDEKITKIVEGDILIWEPIHNEYSNSVILNTRYNEFKLVNIRIITENGGFCRHFRKEEGDNVWYETECTISTNPYNYIVIDVTKIDNPHYHITTTKYGNQIVRYHTLIYNRIISIMDGDKIIWRSSNSCEFCAKCTSYIRRGEFKLIKLEISNDLLYESLFFEKSSYGYWIRITSDYYFIISRIISTERSINLINSISNDEFDVEIALLLNISSNIYAPRLGICITEVKDGNDVIWYSENFERVQYAVCHLKYRENKLIILEIAISNDRIFKCFYKSMNDGWIEINRTEYTHKLFLIAFGQVFNLQNYDMVNPIYHYITYIGNERSVYMSSPYYAITKVIDGNNILWDSYDEYECNFLIIHTRNKIPVLLSLESTRLNPTCIYYKLYNDNWILIEQDVYIDLTNRMENELIIDINKRLYHDKLVIYYHNINNTTSYTYTALNNTFISKVKDKNQIIWEESNWDSINYTKCTFVIVHYYNFKPKFVHLYIKTKEYTDGNKFYEKINGNWIEVEKNNFYNSMELETKEYKNMLRTKSIN